LSCPFLRSERQSHGCGPLYREQALRARRGWGHTNFSLGYITIGLDVIHLNQNVGNNPGQTREKQGVFSFLVALVPWLAVRSVSHLTPLMWRRARPGSTDEVSQASRHRAKLLPPSRETSSYHRRQAKVDPVPHRRTRLTSVVLASLPSSCPRVR
jgi:hypothetical protein